jgi:hypothetical protein
LGGKALQNLGVVRLNKFEYRELTADIKARIYPLIDANLELIKSYEAKETFGDADFLISQNYLPSRWIEVLKAEFNSRGSVSNGNVVSMEINNFQVDFICTPREEMEWASTYFAYNDLGNLMGRIAHKMGFKYRHTGLVKVFRDEDRIIAEVPVRASPEDVFDFLGYDFKKWQQGFHFLEDIFEFTANNQYFDPDIYLLNNRNHVSRVRDAKRATYTGFLEWCKGKKGTYDWKFFPKEISHKIFLNKAFERWPGFASRYALEVATHDNVKVEREFFNGRLVMEWTGFTGQDLGILMAHVRNFDMFHVHLMNRNLVGIKEVTMLAKEQISEYLNKTVI